MPESIYHIFVDRFSTGEVYLDFVPNHVHVTHPFFQDAKSNPHSKYRDWFVWKKYPTE